MLYTRANLNLSDRNRISLWIKLASCHLDPYLPAVAGLTGPTSYQIPANDGVTQALAKGEHVILFHALLAERGSEGVYI